MKKFLPYIILLAAVILLFFLVGRDNRKKTVWEESYAANDKNPFGSYLIFQFRDVLFPEKEVELVSKAPFEMLAGDQVPLNYIFINSIFDLSYQDMEALDEYVAAGNNVWIAAERYYGVFSKRFAIQTDIAMEIEDSVSINFTNPLLRQNDFYIYEKKSVQFYFSSFQEDSAVALGRNDRGNINFIRIDHGKGRFFLSSVPMAFTNYYMLKEGNFTYPFKALSYLPVADAYWDEYYKKSSRVSQSPLMVIMGSPNLRWAYYLMLFAVILFILFRIKRNQRVIPEIKPLPNTTLQFVKTIGNLYFHQGTHQDIALKKTLYFKDYLRNRFYLKVTELNEEVAIRLSQKSGVALDEVKVLFTSIKRTQNSSRLTLKQLISLNEMIEDFYEKTK